MKVSLDGLVMSWLGGQDTRRSVSVAVVGTSGGDVANGGGGGPGALGEGDRLVLRSATSAVRVLDARRGRSCLHLADVGEIGL